MADPKPHRGKLVLDNTSGRVIPSRQAGCQTMRYQFKIEGKALRVNLPGKGWGTILTASTAAELRETFEQNWRGIIWETPTSGTFEAFQS